MMRKIFLLALLTGTSVLLAGSWERLGSRKVKHRAERDQISVTASEGRFSKIKIVVRERAVRILDLKIHYGDGSVHDVQIRALIPAGGESRVIDLPGKKRVIRKVVFTYKTQGGGKGKKATVVLWGRH